MKITGGSFSAVTCPIAKSTRGDHPNNYHMRVYMRRLNSEHRVAGVWRRTSVPCGVAGRGHFAGRTLGSDDNKRRVSTEVRDLKESHLDRDSRIRYYMCT